MEKITADKILSCRCDTELRNKVDLLAKSKNKSHAEMVRILVKKGLSIYK